MNREICDKLWDLNTMIANGSSLIAIRGYLHVASDLYGKENVKAALDSCCLSQLISLLD